MVTVYDVTPNKLVAKAAAKLEAMGIPAPAWVGTVKSGSHRERMPQQKNFWYVRLAAILRNAYVNSSVGVSSLRTHFGGKNQDYWFLQIVGKNARKNIALRRLAAMLEIPPGTFVAVGDNYNDADMIAGADIGVAMGNAPDEIKELAEVVVASNNCSGLAQVVEDIILSGDRFS